MRLVLTLRGTDVIDLELRWPSKAEAEPPGIEASGQLAGNELAEPTAPDTFVFGISPRREA